ncbi:MAG: patatin-like phospholipase family protein [Gammaproteobacteria bacterium]
MSGCATPPRRTVSAGPALAARLLLATCLLLASPHAPARDLRVPAPPETLPDARPEAPAAVLGGFQLPAHAGGRPRVVLVLSGGGARGGAHIGVLRALEALQVPVDAIVGTSMGAVVGGLYAAGLGPNALERIAVETDWTDLFNDAPPRSAFRMRYKQQDDKLLVRGASGIGTEGLRLPQGYLQGHKVKALFRRHTLQVADVTDFTRLPIPFIAVAADIATGAPVLLHRGDLPQALFASMAIPAFVAPQQVDGRLLVDGGVANNLPIDVALALGADVIIAVDVSSPMYAPEALNSVFTVTDQLTNLLTRRNTEAQIARLRGEDVLLTPDLGEAASVDFSRMEGVITAGVRATEYRTVELARLAVGATDWMAWRDGQRRRTRRALAVAEIAVASPSEAGNGSRNTSTEITPRGVDAARLVAESGLEPGRLTVDEIQAGADRLYGLELFSEVPWQFDDGRLLLSPVRKAWGPNYLRAGFGLEDDFEGRNHYRLGLAFTATEVNGLGGEWRSELYLGDRPSVATEFHQPFGRTRDWYVQPGVAWRSFTRPVYDGDDRLADLRIRQNVQSLAAGRTFGTTTDLRLSLESARGNAERLVGATGIVGGDADTGSFNLALEHDSLDNVFFPTRGRTVALRARWSDERLGASAGYAAWSGELAQAFSIGPHSLLASAAWDSVYRDTAPFHEAFTLGGFFRLSGLPVDALVGQHRALHRLAYYYRLPVSSVAPLHLGASLETGGVWDAGQHIDLHDLDLAGSLFLGLDSPIGPVYLGGGMAEDGRASLYIFLGQPF